MRGQLVNEQLMHSLTDSQEKPLKQNSNMQNWRKADNTGKQERQSKQERHREARLQTGSETQTREASKLIKEEWWRAYLQAATRGITVIVSVTPLLCHPSFSLYLSLPLFVPPQTCLSQKSASLSEALQRLILFVYQCAREKERGEKRVRQKERGTLMYFSVSMIKSQKKLIFSGNNCAFS